jgi:hypothetical protein
VTKFNKKNRGVSKAVFSRIIDTSQYYVTKLQKSGRLVLDDKGLILVDESKKLIEKTADPSFSDVAQRNAANRAEKQGASNVEIAEIMGDAGVEFQNARAMREKYVAMQAKVLYQKTVGELLPLQQTSLAVMDGDAIVRNKLENMPDILAPRIAAETDENRVRAILIDHVESILTDLSKSFMKMAKKNVKQPS